MRLTTGAYGPPAAAAKARPRLVGVDMARCIALIGMMATHLLLPFDGFEVRWHQQLAGGRSAALFAVLAGVSIALMSGGPAPPVGRYLAAARSSVLVRALLVGSIGLLLGPLQSFIVVILAYYGVLFALSVPFLGLGWRSLAALGGAWAIVAPVVSQLVRSQLPQGQDAAENPTFARLLADPAGMLSQIELTGFYPALTWMPYVLVGMAIGRLDLTSAKVAARLMVAGGVLAVTSWGISWTLLHRLGGEEALRATVLDGGLAELTRLNVDLVFGLHGATPTTTWWWLAVASPHSGTPFDLLHTISTSMLVLGACLLLAHARSPLLGVVFAAGAMPLSAYTGHILAVWLEIGPTRGTTAAFVVQALTVLVAAAVWRVTLGGGPLERVLAGPSRWAATRTLAAAPWHRRRVAQDHADSGRAPLAPEGSRNRSA